ncbi:MAG: helix-turn-helix domain-containing protein [Bacteroidales bacterium]|nr:helix-turn-helix domain-containing protein [Bacteroidales bacterium]
MGAGPKKGGSMTDKEITQVVCAVLGVSEDDISGHSRWCNLVFARFILSMFLLERTSLDMEAIAERMHRQTKTIAYYVERYREDYNSFPRFKAKADAVRRALDGEV